MTIRCCEICCHMKTVMVSVQICCNVDWCVGHAELPFGWLCHSSTTAPDGDGLSVSQGGASQARGNEECQAGEERREGGGEGATAINDSGGGGGWAATARALPVG